MSSQLTYRLAVLRLWDGELIQRNNRDHDVDCKHMQPLTLGFY